MIPGFRRARTEIWTPIGLHDLFDREGEHTRHVQVFLCVGDVLVDLVRFELTTSSMPWKRAPNCATGPSLFSNMNNLHHYT